MVKENRRLTGTLLLKGISLTLKLGALPVERIEPRQVKIDLEWVGDLLSNGKPTVDYAVVCDALKNDLSDGYEYIEELAQNVMGILESRWAGSWTVSVHKDHPPGDPHMERATITIEG